MKIFRLLPLAVLSLSTLLFAQVPSINVYCDQSDFDTMYENWGEEIEIDCTVVVGDSVYTGARIRLRGDTSRHFPKKGFRITFSDSQPLYGRTKWNFNADYLDHTYIHSWLFSWIMHKLGYPCFTIDHVRFYVNDDYIGLYVRAEPIDEQFLQDWGMDPDGNLYKASVDGACLSRYDDVEQVWEKKANESENWNDLYDLIDYMDQVDGTSMHETAGDVFDVNRLITFLAVNTLTMNYSTYYHNYFVYRDIRNTGLWTCLPWDVDKLWGDWTDRTYTASTNGYWYDNPLLEKVILDPVLLPVYFDRVDSIASTVLDPAVIDPVVDSLEMALESAVADDQNDAIDTTEFHAAIAQLRDERIPQRITYLSSMFTWDVPSFRTFPGDTLSLGDKFVNWESAHDPQGGDIIYLLHLYTVDGWPSTEYEYHTLSDTFYTFTSLPPGHYYWRVEAGVASGNYINGYDKRNPFTVIDQWTELSGTMSGNNTLTKDHSPYYVTGDVTIPSSASLTIQPGVDLRFAQGVGIQCSGHITSLGNQSDSVRFMADDISRPWSGIKLVGADATFTGTSFSGSDGYTSTSDYRSCIEAFDSDLELSGCYFYENRACIRSTGGTFMIDSCDVSGWNHGELLCIMEADEATVQNSVFGNMVNPPSSHDDGVEFHKCLDGNYTIRNCSIFNIDGDGIDTNSSDLLAQDNRIWNVTDKGVSVGIGSTGDQPSNVVLSGNIISDCYTGIAVKDDSYASVTGCTVTLCDIGLRCYAKTSGFGSGDMDADNCILHGNGVDISLEDGSPGQVIYSLTGSDEPWPGTGNIAGDPMFTDWGDYHLSYLSPCIDSGDPSISDPDGTRSDMGAVFFPQQFHNICINEIQSVNDTTIADSYGEYDDWFELYNGGDYDCDLSWAYVSDDPSRLDLYQFPPGTIIPAGGYLVVWADGHYWQEGLHVPFQLSGDGDSIYVSRQPAGVQDTRYGRGGTDALKIVDSINFGDIPPDRSYGRIRDGDSQWSLLEFCTPGWSNSLPAPQGGYLQLSSVFPNPVFSGSAAIDLTVDGGMTEIRVYDIAGRMIDEIYNGHLESGEYRFYWDTMMEDGRAAPTGVYFIHVLHSAGLSQCRKLVLLND